MHVHYIRLNVRLQSPFIYILNLSDCTFTLRCDKALQMHAIASLYIADSDAALSIDKFEVLGGKIFRALVCAGKFFLQITRGHKLRRN